VRKEGKFLELAWAKTERKVFNGDDIGVAYGGGTGFCVIRRDRYV